MIQVGLKMLENEVEKIKAELGDELILNRDRLNLSSIKLLRDFSLETSFRGV